MTLWLRARSATTLAATLVGVLLAGVLLGQRTLAVPTLFGSGGSGVLLVALLPLAWAGAVAGSFAGRRHVVEARSVRRGARPSRLSLLDASLYVGAVSVAAVAFAAIVVPTGSALAGVGAVLILSGLACVTTLYDGPAHGVLAATTLVIATSVYGPSAPGSRFVRVLQVDGDATWSCCWGVALTLVAAGLLLTDRVRVRLGGTDALE